MNWKRQGQWAIFAQDACNGSGLVFDLNRTVAEMAAEGMTEEQIANHPVLILFADKFDDLCRCRDMPARPAASIVVLMIAFESTMRALCADPASTGTDWRNQHERTKNCVLQLVAITNSRGTDRYSKAYDACKRMEASGQPEPSID